MSRFLRPTFRCSIVIASMAVGQPVAAQSAYWTGAVNGNWNTAGNWNPAGVPNSPSADLSFINLGVGPVNISASVAAHSLTFYNSALSYTLTSSAGQVLNSLTAITVADQFHQHRTYEWPIIRPRSAADVDHPDNITPINTAAAISIFDTVTNTTISLSDVNLNAYMRFDDSQWNWGSIPPNERGAFRFELWPDKLGEPDRVIALTYAP